MRALPTTTGKPARSWIWAQGIVCGAVVAIAPGTAVLLATLAAPALGMLATAGYKRDAPVRAMLLASSASACMPLRLLWDQGGTLSGSLDLLTDPSRPLLAWVACGAAWLTCHLVEAAVRFVDQSRTSSAATALAQERLALLNEWSAS